MPNLISQTILSMAAERGPDKTICPSDVARVLFPANWRRQMDAVRNEAIALHKNKQVLITQRGRAIDTAHIHGPIRIKIITAG